MNAICAPARRRGPALYVSDQVPDRRLDAAVVPWWIAPADDICADRANLSIVDICCKRRPFVDDPSDGRIGWQLILVDSVIGHDSEVTPNVPSQLVEDGIQLRDDPTIGIGAGDWTETAFLIQ
jgi:hypothetical protein